VTITATPPPDLKRQYPHVDGVADWRAQQTIRLLWDRVFDLEARLQGVQATQVDLTAASNQQEADITRVDRQSKEALAIAQRTPIERGVLDGSGGGDGSPTTDGGLGMAGCDVAGATGDAVGPFTGLDLTVTNAGSVVCGVGNEFPALLVATATRAIRHTNRDELLDRIVWHLGQAGFAAARYHTTEGMLYHVLFDAVALDGSLPLRQYAYRVTSYDPDPAAPWDPANVMTTLMSYGGQSAGLTTTPESGIAD
jgi:hypothetical protein